MPFNPWEGKGGSYLSQGYLSENEKIYYSSILLYCLYYWATFVLHYNLIQVSFFFLLAVVGGDVTQVTDVLCFGSSLLHFDNIFINSPQLCQYDNIHIYSHPQTDCFVLSELFSVARYVGRSKPGSKPVQLYVRLCFRPSSGPRWLKEF